MKESLFLTGVSAIIASQHQSTRHKIFSFAACALLLASSICSASNSDNLPVLGDATSGVISQAQEYRLGQSWLKVFRSRVQTLDDPQLQYYLEELLYDLAEHSEITDHRLELIIINNPSMNAFAVPGGIIGVHTGLFRFAENEHQLASVLSHELAHLSQRHFARRLQSQKASTIGTMAGLLAGIILAATVGADAGMAAMTATQALALDSSLRFSRQNEQEADRIGIKTLYQSGRDPAAVSRMFERMLAATRYTGQRPPEFLLTHPLTEKRVADARNRINNYPAKQYPLLPQFNLMRARALIYIDNNPQKSVKRFSNELAGYSISKTAASYGLALALSLRGDHPKAWALIQALLDEQPKNIILQLAAIEIQQHMEDYEGALARIKNLEVLHNNNTALQRSKAEVLLKASRYQESERVLTTLSKKRPTDPEVWFQLAEINGLSGNISGVHIARAEFFLLIGVFDQAREQLQYAQRLVKSDYKQNAIIEQRLKDIAKLQAQTEKL